MKPIVVLLLWKSIQKELKIELKSQKRICFQQLPIFLHFSNDYFQFNSKILELEEELKVVGNNMKVLEISEQEAIQREESYAEQIKECTTRLKEVFLSK